MLINLDALTGKCFNKVAPPHTHTHPTLNICIYTHSHITIIAIIAIIIAIRQVNAFVLSCVVTSGGPAAKEKMVAGGIVALLASASCILVPHANRVCMLFGYC